MTVLVTGQFQEQARGLAMRSGLRDVVRILENLSPDQVDSSSLIHKVPEQENVYALKYGKLRFFFTLREGDAVLIGVNEPKLDVSAGQRLNFAANGVPASGVIVSSERTVGPWATVTVETETPIPNNAQLTMPDLPETGGCGSAQPVQHGGRVRVDLSIGYSYIDFNTIGR